MDVRHRNLHANPGLHVEHTLTRRRAGLSLLTLAAIVAAAPPALAQRAIEASPLRVEIQVNPGGTHTQAVTITNPGIARARIRTTLADWHLTKDGAPQFETPLAGRPYAAASWVRFAPPEFTLEPSQKGIVRFTVNVPADAQPGGYRTGLLFELVPETEEKTSGSRQVIIRTRMATLIYINVGQPPPSIDMTNLEVRGTAEQTQIVAVLKNSSRRTVRTKGTLIVSDSTGLAVAQVIVPDVPVLPESERELGIRAAEAMKPLPAGDYKVELKLDLGMPALVVGETTLRVTR